MELTLTTAPDAASSSSIRPRASMMGAKKLTWNTCCQSSIGVSREESRLPPSPFGETAALLTSAFSCEPCARNRSLISAMARMVLSVSARSTWM
jgi:hypothetical protein